MWLYLFFVAVITAYPILHPSFFHHHVISMCYIFSTSFYSRNCKTVKFCSHFLFHNFTVLCVNRTLKDCMYDVVQHLLNSNFGNKCLVLVIYYKLLTKSLAKWLVLHCKLKSSLEDFSKLYYFQSKNTWCNPCCNIDTEVVLPCVLPWCQCHLVVLNSNWNLFFI